MKCDGGFSGDRCTTPEHVERDVHALADADLLSVLLAGGRADPRSAEVARKLLDEWGGLAGLAGASHRELRSCGLRVSQAAALLATREIACRLASQQVPEWNPLGRPEELARFLVLRYQLRDQELMGALFLSVRRRLLGHKEIFRGTLYRIAVEPREILKECLLRGAAALALFHTHPSGDATPSGEDLLFTRRMAEAATVVGVELVDHLVLGATGRWVSLKARGGW